jgi:hypothetical protein
MVYNNRLYRVPRTRLFKGSILLLIVWAVAAQTQSATVTTRLDHPGAALYATIGGTERKIADSAEKAWVLRHGLDVVYSGRDGAGGYENEGQSLYIFNTETGDRRKVMSEYYMVEAVREADTSTGKTALLVEMTDRNIDASHVAVVDPARGEVFCEDGAKLKGVVGDAITLAYYGDDDWDALPDNPGMKPQKTEEFDLKKVLERPVMTNQPT